MTIPYKKALLTGAMVVAAALAVLSWPIRAPQVSFPGGKRFAFSIVDDTDLTTLARVRPVYDTLRKYGLRTTKTVWVAASSEPSRGTNLGDTLEDEPYRAFVRQLQQQGFEIALHGIRGGSSTREEIVAGLDAFSREFGHFPRMQVNHSLNRDNLYWDRHRFSVLPFRLAASVAMSSVSGGHDPTSPYFWGDLARQHIKYVRQFTFQEINVLNVNPSLPYRRSDTPYVNYWFQTSDGANREAFVNLLSPENLDRLEREGGVSLVYAHLGAGSFAAGDAVDPRFEARIKDLASRNGWFVPASDILDHLAARPEWTGTIAWRELLRMEARFIVGELAGGGR